MQLQVNQIWNAGEHPDKELHATIDVSTSDAGIRVTVSAPWRNDMYIPDAPIGRLDGLWDYDVVELFLVGPEHNYLEIELGAGGHWLVLAFDEIRQRSNSYEDLELQVDYSKSEHRWTSSTTIPWEVVPRPVHAWNGFVIARGQFLAAHALPGEEPDYHQPDHFPAVVLKK